MYLECFTLRRSIQLNKVKFEFPSPKFRFSKDFVEGLYEEEVTRLAYDFRVFYIMKQQFYNVYMVKYSSHAINRLK